MSVTESERERFDRASRRLVASQLDDLTLESAANALSLSEAALNNSPPEIRIIAEAIAGQAIAFTHFISGSPKFAADAASKAVALHIRDCEKLKAAQSAVNTSGGNFIVEAKKSLVSTPMALSVFLSVCVFKFGDKIFGLFF